LLRHLLHDVVVDIQQVVAAHARLAWQTACDDDDVGVGAFGIITCPKHARIRAPDRARLEHVECDAGRLLVCDIDDHHIRALLVRHSASDGRTHVTGATDDCYFAIHVDSWPKRDATTPLPKKETRAFVFSCASHVPDDSVPELGRPELGRTLHQTS